MWRIGLGVLALGACGRIGFDPGGSMTDGLGVEITISFQDGVFPTASYHGTSDTFLLESDPTMPNGMTSRCVIDGDDPPGSSDDSIALVRWDVSAIPVGSLVRASTITFTSESSSGDSYEVFELLRGWDELDATWNESGVATAWQIPGAHGAAERNPISVGVTPNDPPQDQPTAVVLNTQGVAMVQRWVDGANFGIVLADPTQTNGLDISCRETNVATARPMVTVTYVPP